VNNRIKIIVPFYNPGEFLEQCVATVMSQKYDNYQVIFIDDCSTDGSYDKLPHNDERVIIIRNDVRKTALENIHNSIMNHCEPDDIVVLLDGDDYLLNKHVLSFVSDFYNEHDCWFSYGSAVWSNGAKCFSRPYTKEEFKNIKSIPFKISHLRSFKGGAYFSIVNQDPELKCMKDKNGEWYKSGYDTAICYPLLQICGYEKVKHNPKPIYFYRLHENNDHNINQKLQWDVHGEVLKKADFKQIFEL